MFQEFFGYTPAHLGFRGLGFRVLVLKGLGCRDFYSKAVSGL